MPSLGVAAVADMSRQMSRHFGSIKRLSRQDSEADETAATGRNVTVGPCSLGARLVQRPGPNVPIALGTSDFAVDRNRLTFLVIKPDRQLVEVPRARVFLGRTAADKARLVARAPLVRVGPTRLGSEAPALYITALDFADAGAYWLVVEPEGSSVQAYGELKVRDQTKSLSVGSKAYPSDNPTLGDAPLSLLTTADPPDRELLRYSIRDSLADGVPFVVTFATPKHCETRTCGPTVEVVDEVRRRYESRGIRFIHIEVYEDNDPAKGVNRWMREWRLPTEPWVFVVGGDRIIKAKFESAVSVAELEQAVQKHLLG
jgi:hypothetical protein